MQAITEPEARTEGLALADVAEELYNRGNYVAAVAVARSAIDRTMAVLLRSHGLMTSPGLPSGWVRMLALRRHQVITVDVARRLKKAVAIDPRLRHGCTMNAEQARVVVEVVRELAGIGGAL